VLRTVARCAFVLGSLLAAAGAAGCAATDAEDEEVVASEEAALTALEQQIGFDGAVEKLDERALLRVDEEARSLESRGLDPGAVERAATRRVLVEARARGAGGVGTRSLAPLGVYDSDLLKLNGLERTLCKRARIACVRVLLAGVRARSASQAAYDDGNVGGRIDAFRHTYWNAAMVRSVGEAKAKEWADAHENGYPDNRATAANRILSDMDFHNNAEGRRIGLELRRASDDDVQDAVRDAIADGTLRAVRYDLGAKDGKLVPSSACTGAVRCGR
jgi:hypothetical protein